MGNNRKSTTELTKSQSKQEIPAGHYRFISHAIKAPFSSDCLYKRESNHSARHSDRVPLFFTVEVYKPLSRSQPSSPRQISATMSPSKSKTNSNSSVPNITTRNRSCPPKINYPNELGEMKSGKTFLRQCKVEEINSAINQCEKKEIACQRVQTKINTEFNSIKTNNSRGLRKNVLNYNNVRTSNPHKEVKITNNKPMSVTKKTISTLDVILNKKENVKLTQASNSQHKCPSDYSKKKSCCGSENIKRNNCKKTNAIKHQIDNTKKVNKQPNNSENKNSTHHQTKNRTAGNQQNRVNSAKAEAPDKLKKCIKPQDNDISKPIKPFYFGLRKSQQDVKVEPIIYSSKVNSVSPSLSSETRRLINKHTSLSNSSVSCAWLSNMSYVNRESAVTYCNIFKQCKRASSGRNSPIIKPSASPQKIGQRKLDIDKVKYRPCSNSKPSAKAVTTVKSKSRPSTPSQEQTPQILNNDKKESRASSQSLFESRSKQTKKENSKPYQLKDTIRNRVRSAEKQDKNITNFHLSKSKSDGSLSEILSGHQIKMKTDSTQTDENLLKSSKTVSLFSGLSVALKAVVFANQKSFASKSTSSPSIPESENFSSPILKRSYTIYPHSGTNKIPIVEKLNNNKLIQKQPLEHVGSTKKQNYKHSVSLCDKPSPKAKKYYSKIESSDIARSMIWKKNPPSSFSKLEKKGNRKVCNKNMAKMLNLNLELETIQKHNIQSIKKKRKEPTYNVLNLENNPSPERGKQYKKVSCGMNLSFDSATLHHLLEALPARHSDLPSLNHLPKTNISLDMTHLESSGVPYWESESILALSPIESNHSTKYTYSDTSNLLENIKMPDFVHSDSFINVNEECSQPFNSEKYKCIFYYPSTEELSQRLGIDVKKTVDIQDNKFDLLSDTE